MSAMRSISSATFRGVQMAVVALALVGVAPSQGWAQSTSEPVLQVAPKEKVHTRLVVENDNWLDARLYLVRNGETVASVGYVNALGKSEFELPSLATDAGGDIQILVHLIGGSRSYLSPVAMINPGDTVEMVIQNSLG